MTDGANDTPQRPADAEMDLGAVRELLRMMVETDIAEIAFERGDFKLHVKRGASQPVVMTPSMAASMQAAHAAAMSSQGAIHAPAAGLPGQHEPDPPLVGHAINAPMVGTYYASPSPKDSVFIHEGDVIQPGDCVGIIEAMKIMNEISSDIGGRVGRILVKNGQSVEYGQPLVLIEPL